ncbi:MAG: xanthine dehydrogenase family protein molybdopterin-binding subunit [Gammaproteobacteria bacterium]|nr:xanthine dehydrogenase family protein molybdopterin-binding subunit [Gammaproteobacteria bacterium]
MSTEQLGPALTRRTLLKTSAVAGGGLIVGVNLTGCASAPTLGAEGDLSPDAWLQITPDDRVIFQLDKTEMGQGVITSLPTLVGEELNLDPARIHVHLAPVHPRFQDPIQITGGSTSIANRYQPLRQTGAAARDMLIGAAAERWSVPASDLELEDGAVHHRGSGRSARFGELAEAAARQSIPKNPTLKPASEFRWIGQSVPRTDRVTKSTGQAAFGIDVGMNGQQLPNLATAVVIRAPRFGAELQGFDAQEARKVPGVIDVIAVSSGVAVIAKGYWPARQAAGKVDARWSEGPLKGLDSASIEAAQRRALDEQKGRNARNDGNFARAAEQAHRVIDAEYVIPHLAHATMEPMNCTAWLHDGICDVWVPTQGPDIVQAVAAEAAKLPRNKVHVHSTLMGGGFGRRGIPDYAAEAVEVARLAGRPVKVVWSREDDMRHDFYRPATCNRLRAALDDNGTVTGWEHRLVGPSIIGTLVPDFLGALMPTWVPGGVTNVLGRAGGAVIRGRDSSSTEGAADLPYAIDHVRVESILHDPGVPIGFWRSVGHSQNAFVVESFVDEVAHAAGADPLAFRLERLAGHPRHLATLKLAADKANWGHPAEGRSQGVAVHESFGSVVTEIAEVSVENGRIRVHRVVCAIDCGLVINPDIVRAQMEGSIVFGLTAALKSKVTLKDGGIRQSNFHDYDLLRMDETPVIDVYFVNQDAPPSGVGEPGLPPIAPAVANAVFAATGQRLRTMPLRLA